MSIADTQKSLKKGSRRSLIGEAISGRITEISWDAVTIAWDNGQVATVHHGEIANGPRVPTRRLL